jgi:mycothiol synthase
MNLHPYASSGEADQLKMLSLAQAFPASHLHTVDLPYRLASWGLDEPENTRLWETEDGELLGWAVLQPPFWTVDCTCHPEAENALFPEMLAWADQRAQAIAATRYGRPAWFVNVFTSQTQRILALEAAGFADQADLGEDSWSKVLMQRDGQEPIRQYSLPKGFTVRPLAGTSEVAAYVTLHQETFESKNMTVEWRARTLQQPAYTPDLDIVIAASDERLGAFCIGWLMCETNGDLIGQIEPLGCHPAFRRFALGRLALVEVLRRMQVLGVKSILVETDNYRSTALALYESLGFHPLQAVGVFRKDYGGIK